MVELAWVPFSVPLLLVINREITHPQLLDWARWRSPGSALSPLFSEDELAHPKALSRTFLPLLAAESVATSIIWGIARVFDFLANSSDRYIRNNGFEEPVPQFEFTREFFGKTWPWFVAILVLVPFKMLPALIVCPLEVAAVRISSQRAAPAPDDISAQKAAPVPTHEPVIRLRDAPYDGLFDCLRGMAREEGWRALYSACWVTLLFTVHGLSWRMIAGMRFP
ncbi:hypothetical protein AURDEDRAFT_142115 [Auricularia subglabra TFB-10046 SS5]|nr:hypothetical protein AURDEDRAFT_142115 [Auricularia subglabra TFB-10046 SS5]